MVELTTKVTQSGVLYIPKEIRQCFGRNMKIIPNATAAVFFAATTDYVDVLESLRIIEFDIRHRIRLAKERSKR
jgi:hypothetical protein